MFSRRGCFVDWGCRYGSFFCNNREEVGTFLISRISGSLWETLTICLYQISERLGVMLALFLIFAWWDWPKTLASEQSFPWAVFWRHPGAPPVSMFWRIWATRLFSFIFDARTVLLGVCLNNFQARPQYQFQDILGCCFWIVLWWLRELSWSMTRNRHATFFILCSFRFHGKGHALCFVNWASLGTDGFYVIRCTRGGSMWTPDHVGAYIYTQNCFLL